MDCTWIPLALSLALLGWQPAPNPRAAVISAAEADEDFAVQGEYLGWVRGAYGPRMCGLQVVALGGGSFEAVRFEGGLPGHGAVVLPGHAMRGQRAGDLVELTGEDETRIVIAAGRAECQSAAATGCLDKFERVSPTMGLRPPPKAIVLFGETGSEPNFDKFRLADDGTLLAGATTNMPVHDFTLHVEFRTPYMPHARGQGRGNSGVYIQRRYEVQILDSFGLAGTNNECGGLYRQQAPDLNMCLPPLSWQTYDIQFRAARWDESGKKIENAELTVFHNGVAVHYHRSIPNKTGAGQTESPVDLPIYFQDHGNPVTFRNVWLVAEEPAAAVAAGCPPTRPTRLAGRLFRRR